MKYYVIGTFRQDRCNPNSAIAGLVLGARIDGHDVFTNEDLKALADADRLWVRVERPYASTVEVKVKIFWSPTHSKWIAETEADFTRINNLLNLPIYGSLGNDSYSLCSLY